MACKSTWKAARSLPMYKLTDLKHKNIVQLISMISKIKQVLMNEYLLSCLPSRKNQQLPLACTIQLARPSLQGLHPVLLNPYHWIHNSQTIANLVRALAPKTIKTPRWQLSFWHTHTSVREVWIPNRPKLYIVNSMHLTLKIVQQEPNNSKKKEKKLRGRKRKRRHKSEHSNEQKQEEMPRYQCFYRAKIPQEARRSTALQSRKKQLREQQPRPASALCSS